MRICCWLAAALLTIGAVCSDFAALAQTMDSGANLSAFVSPGLPAAERDYIMFRIGRLPRHLREMLANSDPAEVHLTFIDGRTGAIHHNRPEDVGTVREADAVELPGDLAPGFRPPPAGYDPGVTKNTGPYRRIYTTPLKAMPANYAKALASYFSGAEVSVGCNAGSFKHDETHSDLGYTYLGGWSTQPNKPGGSVDAGLQYNFEASKKSGDNYTPFIAVSGSAAYLGTKGYVASGQKITCSDTTPIVLEFDVFPDVQSSDCQTTNPDCHTYSLGLAVANTKGKLLQSVIWTVPNEGATLGVDFGGWATLNDDGTNYWAETRCGGCIFKYMTSIAQKKPGDYHDGSTYQATWANRYIACYALKCDKRGDPVAVTAAILDCSEYPTWYDNVYEHGQRDCTATPKATKGLSLSVQSSGYSALGESVSISLTH